MSGTLLASLPERAVWPFAVKRHNHESSEPLFFHYSSVGAANLMLDLMEDESDTVTTTLFVANLNPRVLYSAEPGVGWIELTSDRFDTDNIRVQHALRHKAARRAEMGV